MRYHDDDDDDEIEVEDENIIHGEVGTFDLEEFMKRGGKIVKEEEDEIPDIAINISRENVILAGYSVKEIKALKSTIIEFIKALDGKQEKKGIGF